MDTKWNTEEEDHTMMEDITWDSDQEGLINTMAEEDLEEEGESSKEEDLKRETKKKKKWKKRLKKRKKK